MPKNSALAIAPATLSTESLTALLQQSGDLSVSSGDSFRRMRLDGGMLVTLDGQGEVEEMFPPKVVKGVPQPALTVQIVSPPVYYNAFWLGPELDEKGQPTGAVDANRINRPDLNKNFSKRYDDPAEQAKDNNPANDVYDDIERATGKRGAFKADIRVRIVENNELSEDAPIYSLSLSASSALDWRGTRKNPTGGVGQEKNFIIQLAEFAAQLAADNGADEAGQEKAVLDAMFALRMGGVIADIYLNKASNNDNSRVWTVVCFKPVQITEITAPTAITEGSTVAEAEASLSDDDLPF
jgi:hypothetical protein